VQQAEQLFTRVLTNVTNRWAATSGLLKTAQAGSALASTHIAQDNRQFVEAFLSDPGNDRLFGDKAGFVAWAGGADGLSANITREQLANFSHAVDAAALVFMHAALDAAVSDLCRVTALLAPGDWETFLEDQKVTLSQLKGTTYDALLAAKLETHLDALDRESLLKRVDRMFALCRPPKDFDPMRNYTFDRNRVDQIDRLRQRIVHGDDPFTPIADIPIQVEYMAKTAMFMMTLVNHRYKVKFNPLHTFTSLVGAKPSTPPASA